MQLYMGHPLYIPFKLLQCYFGIVLLRWWLEAERVNRSVDEVSNALENLSKTGEITRQKVDGSNPIL